MARLGMFSEHVKLVLEYDPEKEKNEWKEKVLKKATKEALAALRKLYPKKVREGRWALCDEYGECELVEDIELHIPLAIKGMLRDLAGSQEEEGRWGTIKAQTLFTWGFYCFPCPKCKEEEDRLEEEDRQKVFAFRLVLEPKPPRCPATGYRRRCKFETKWFGYSSHHPPIPYYRSSCVYCGRICEEWHEEWVSESVFSPMEERITVYWSEPEERGEEVC